MGAMTIEPYRQVLALPGVRPLILLAMLARVPVTAVGVTLTLTALPVYRTAQRISRPPATSMVIPVNQEEASEARNRVV